MEKQGESPIVSFRVPLEIIEKLIAKGLLKPNYNKSDLSRIAKDELLKSVDAGIPIPVNADEVLEKVDTVHTKIDEVLELLRGKSLA
ncbi:MAG: hypothetical protein PUP92_17070 [Rhizonema sp. PD38]|nr:hypothetical protein [Rhizonema sp. PD38]